ncbi:NAD dependent epimerase/dehydratase family protein [Geobacter sp. OR-1]|uniref:NAD-dependent epimerase/dehydratase family protein n=1 Tax=Geobacter sp. OR-1 TaxID=1266765 RepID=UPI000543DA09|nr:NAD-dependent epimerase/dehydratase family protein [Geobacter sp. OR-1]GAM11012.1 NAD dependent epimerase/dehydratase family protein [Geobacter sp. OR-1]
MKAVRVAILGATSHIAKGLIASWVTDSSRKLLLYARSPERVSEFLSIIESDRYPVFPMAAFGLEPVDVVVNCVGIGDPGRLKNDVAAIFSVTEYWDSKVLEYLKANPAALYLNFSSGAVYGGDFTRPANEMTQATFPVNALAPSDYYGIAKLHAEARHRAASGLNIVDLRVFSYFSRFVDLSTRFLLTDVAKALKAGEEMQTISANIVRDYIHIEDLTALIDLCISRRRLNAVYDVYSLKPVTKFEMLEAFAERFDLKYRVVAMETVNATGHKEFYFSENHRAAELGYQPAHSSLESLCLEMKSLLTIE